MQLVLEAIHCNRLEDAADLLKLAQNLPLDEADSAGEDDEDAAAEPEGWIARRRMFIDQLALKLEARQKAIGRV